MPAVHHATVHYSGHVQGVGFRYQVMQVAQGFEVAGHVQNLPDGRVLLEVEGPADELRDFLVAVQERMEGFIRQTDQIESARAPQYSGFTIR